MSRLSSATTYSSSSNSSAYTPVRMTRVGELVAAGFLMPPREVTVLAFAGEKGEVVNTNEAVLTVEYNGKEISRTTCTSSNNNNNRSNVPSRPWTTMTTVLLNPAHARTLRGSRGMCTLQPRKENWDVNCASFSIEMTDAAMAKIYYKAVVALLRQVTGYADSQSLLIDPLPRDWTAAK